MWEVHEVNQVCTIKMGVQQVKYKTNPKVTIKHAEGVGLVNMVVQEVAREE